MATTAGSCPKCGAPIYMPDVWMGIYPPGPIYSCSCNGSTAGGRPDLFTTTTITTPATEDPALRKNLDSLAKGFDLIAKDIHWLVKINAKLEKRLDRLEAAVFGKPVRKKAKKR